jgi:hypothetical protein
MWGDSQGRVRTEQPGFPVFQTGDPVAMYTYFVDSVNRVVNRLKVEAAPARGGGGSRGAKVTTEDLGSKTIDGVLVAGTRTATVKFTGRPRTWLGCRRAGSQTNCRARKSKGLCARQTALPEHENGMAVSIRLTRVPAGPCRNRPVRRRFSSRYTWTDCFKAGGLPKLNLP